MPSTDILVLTNRSADIEASFFRIVERMRRRIQRAIVPEAGEDHPRQNYQEVNIMHRRCYFVKMANGS